MKFKEYPYVQARWYSKNPTPKKLLVIHYSAGFGDEMKIANYFAKTERKASAHFSVGRGGGICGHVDTDDYAFACGKSAFRGQSPVGPLSISIELANSAFLDVSKLKPEQIGEAKHRNPDCKERFWEKYTEEQYKSLDELVGKLVNEHPTLQFVSGHEDLQNRYVVGVGGSKTDPGPLFNWSKIQWKSKHNLDQFHYSFRDKKWYNPNEE